MSLLTQYLLLITGMQLINVSDPYSLVAVGTATEGGSFPGLSDPFDVAIFTIGTSVYAIAAGHPQSGPSSGSVQIIDVSIPSNPVALGSATDDTDGFNVLSGARGVATFTIRGSAYAIVAGQNDNGVQIINVTDPSSPQAVSSAVDGAIFTRLKGARDVDTFTIDERTFAIVASKNDKGVQIIDVSDPSNPVPEGVAKRNNNGFKLNNPQGVRAFKIGVRPYALVASKSGCVDLIDLNDPSNPVAVDYAKDGENAYTELGEARQLDTFFIGFHREP